jgi:hypothetical protein
MNLRASSRTRDLSFVKDSPLATWTVTSSSILAAALPAILRVLVASTRASARRLRGGATRQLHDVFDRPQSHDASQLPAGRMALTQPFWRTGRIKLRRGPRFCLPVVHPSNGWSKCSRAERAPPSDQGRRADPAGYFCEQLRARGRIFASAKNLPKAVRAMR